MDAVRTVAKNTAALVGAEGVSRVLTFLVTLYIARSLGAEALGRYSFALAFAALFRIFADMGLNTLTTREVARDHGSAGKYLSNLLAMKLILGPITFFLVYVAILITGKPGELRHLVYVASLWIWMDSLGVLVQSVFSAFESMEYVALLNVVEKAVLFGVSFWALLSDVSWKLIWLLAAYPLASLFAFLLGLAILAKRGVQVGIGADGRFWVDVMRAGWPFALMGIFGGVYLYTDRVLLSLIGGEDEVVGWYTAAAKVFWTVYALQAFFYRALFPTASKAYGESVGQYRRVLRRAGRLMFSYTIPASTVGILLAPWVVRSFYGEGYAPAIPVLQILIVNLVLRGWTGLYGGSVLNVTGRQRDFMYAVGLGAIVNVVLDITLIPSMSLRGVALATVCAEGVVGLVAYLKARRTFELPIAYIWKPVLASGVMAMFWFCGRGTVWVLCGLGAFVGIFWLTGCVRRQDVGFLMASLRRMA
ncbi:MAG TPA: flippase [Candidatus Latescibacteria bacterium]|nr:flippase [Candidatus Latescibacterota bacterium]